MKPHQKLMRLLSPACERHRQEYRESLSRAEAHAEDLTRTCQITGFSKETIMTTDYFNRLGAHDYDRSANAALRGEVLDLYSGDAKVERATLRARAMTWLVRIGLVLLLAIIFWPMEARAEAAAVYAAPLGLNKLVIYQDPCPLGGWFAKWKRATWLISGKPFDACWKAVRGLEGVDIKTIDAAGDTGSVPLGMFKREEGI